MHSAQPKQDGRTAILEAALTQIANGGLSSLRVHRVAAAAGVSPPLVLHHFASKAGLVEACDQHVLAVLHDSVRITEAGGSEASVQALVALPDGELALQYVGRSLADGGPVGRWWFDTIMELLTSSHRRMVDAGLAREVDDPEMLIALAASMDMGMLVLRPLVEAHLGVELTAPETFERWMRAWFDLMTSGYLISPSQPDDSRPHP